MGQLDGYQNVKMQQALHKWRIYAQRKNKGLYIYKSIYSYADRRLFLNGEDIAPESAGTDRPEQGTDQADVMALIYEWAQEQHQNRIPIKRYPERRKNGRNSRKEKNIHDSCQTAV